jgi:hypothetical protein
LIFLALRARDQEDLLRFDKLISEDESITDIRRCEGYGGVFVIIEKKKMGSSICYTNEMRKVP